MTHGQDRVFPGISDHEEVFIESSLPLMMKTSSPCREFKYHKADYDNCRFKRKFLDIVTTVSEHFNLPGHSIKDFSFMPINRVTGNWKRLMKETSWIHRLGTVCAFGF